MRNTKRWINILWVLVVLLTVARLATTAFSPSLTIPVVMATAVFAFIHGALRYRWSGVFAFLVICVGVFYGYHVKGGAVGIGRAVAKTMAISLVMIVVVNAILTQIFWGTNPNLPIPS